jgi:hypothetical protein
MYDHTSTAKSISRPGLLNNSGTKNPGRDSAADTKQTDGAGKTIARA